MTPVTFTPIEVKPWWFKTATVSFWLIFMRKLQYAVRVFNRALLVESWGDFVKVGRSIIRTCTVGSEIREWLKNNNIRGWKVNCFVSACDICFFSKKDAALFKMFFDYNGNFT